MAIEFERIEEQARAGSLTTHQLRKVLNDVSEQITGDSLIAQSTADYLKDWLKGVEARNRPTTLERYGKTVELFLESLGDKAKKPVTAVTPHDLERFLISRLKGGVAPKTAIVDLKSLNGAFRKAEAFGIIVKNPVPAVQMPKEICSEREVFTHEEIQKLVGAAPTVEWQTLILLGYFIGARLTDCAMMKWDNVNPDDGTIVFHQGKTGKKVIVPMHFHIIEHLKYLSAFGTTGPLSPKLAARATGGKHDLSESFKRIVIKAGVDPMVVRGKGTQNFTKRTFHSLRHSFNSHLANAGVSQEVRMKLTGHSSKEMNSRYTHLEVGALRTAMKSIPLFGPPVASSK